MLVNARTRMHEVVREYGDISEAMKARGMKCDGPRWLRRVLRPVVSRVLTVERAARMHGVPLEAMLRMLDDIGAEVRGAGAAGAAGSSARGSSATP